MDRVELASRAAARPREQSPEFSSFWDTLFALYLRFYFPRSFRALRLVRHTRTSGLEDRPVIVFANHPSWWDPLVSLLLGRELFPDRPRYAPIDADALERYKFFRKLGYFGVERGSRRGAADFLRLGERILSDRRATLWITPQGRFTDPRARPVNIEPGLGHLARRIDSVLALPLAVEYPFGEERLPEAWLEFGEPLDISASSPRTPDEWTRLFASALERAQDSLAQRVIERRVEDCDVVLAGAAGVGGVYDWWRRAASWARGRRFQPEHGGERL